MTVTIQKLTRDGFETVGHVHEDGIEGEEAERLLEPLMPMSPEEIVDRIDGPRYVAVRPEPGDSE